MNNVSMLFSIGRKSPSPAKAASVTDFRMQLSYVPTKPKPKVDSYKTPYEESRISLQADGKIDFGHGRALDVSPTDQTIRPSGSQTNS